MTLRDLGSIGVSNVLQFYRRTTGLLLVPEVAVVQHVAKLLISHVRALSHVGIQDCALGTELLLGRSIGKWISAALRCFRWAVAGAIRTS